MDSESALRAIIDERVAAVAARDPKPLSARQHPDIVTFNVLPPLHSRGKAAVEEATRAWFDAYASDIGEAHGDDSLLAAGQAGPDIVRGSADRGPLPRRHP